MKANSAGNPFGTIVNLNEISFFTTKGDILGFDGTNNVRIPAGADGTLLRARAGAANGIEWGIGPTTKGDLLGFDTGLNRIPIGSNDDILVPDSAQALGIKWQNLALLGWKKLDNGTLGSAGLTLATNSFTARRNLLLIVRSNGALSPTLVQLRANGDSGANYASRSELNGAADTTATGASSMALSPPGSSSQAFIIVEISNYTSIVKGFKVETSWHYNAATAPDKSATVGTWNNTAAQITSLSIVNTGASGNWPVGTEWWVYGAE